MRYNKLFHTFFFFFFFFPKIPLAHLPFTPTPAGFVMKLWPLVRLCPLFKGLVFAPGALAAFPVFLSMSVADSTILDKSDRVCYELGASGEVSVMSHCHSALCTSLQHPSVHPPIQQLAVKSLLGAPSPLGNRKNRTRPEAGVSQALKSLYFLICVSGSHEVGGDSSTSCPAPAVPLSLQLPPAWVGGVWGSCLLPHSCLLSPQSPVLLSRRHSCPHPACSFPGTGRLLLNPVLPPWQFCGKCISRASHFPTSRAHQRPGSRFL